MVATQGDGIDLVLFDLDGTLYDERGGMVRALDETLAVARRRLPALDTERAVVLYPEIGRKIWEMADLGGAGPGPPSGSMEVRTLVWSELLEALGCGEEGLGGELASCYARARSRGHSLFEESAAVLAGIGAHFRLGLITNGPSDLQRDKISACGLTDLLDPIVISAEVGVAKPDRRIFVDTVEACGVRPERALYVGDNPIADILGAREAGLTTVWVNRTGEPFPPALPGPDHVISDLRPLLRVVRCDGEEGE